MPCGLVQSSMAVDVSRPTILLLLWNCKQEGIGKSQTEQAAEGCAQRWFRSFKTELMKLAMRSRHANCHRLSTLPADL